MRIQARVLAMAEADVLAMVSPRTIRDIKREDPHPFFKAFCVGQEGEARPKLVGVGATVQRWFRSAIEALAGRLPLGIPAYHEHPKTGESERARQPIGEIVGKALRHIDGMLSAVAVAYVYPAFRDLPLDIASIEANILVPSNSREFDVTDVDVQDVTGIALGSSSNNTPAFPGATLLAQLHAFADGNLNRTPGGSEMKMTLDDLKKAVQESGFKPSELFDGRDLVKDPFIVEHVKEEKGSEYYARKRNQGEFEEKIKKLEDEKKVLEDQIQNHAQAALQVKAKAALEKVLVERPALKADPRLSKFVAKAFDKEFKPSTEDKLPADLNTFIDAHVADYQELFGEAKPTTPAPETKAGEPAPKTGDLTDPRNNDLIPR